MAETSQPINDAVAGTDQHIAPPPRKRAVGFRSIALGTVVLILAVVGIFYYVVYVAPYESTDDAFIDGYVTTVSSRVPGQVLRLLIQDNQKVQAGEVILLLDPRDYEANLAQARAELDSARSQRLQAIAQRSVAQARVSEAEASEVADGADAQRADNDLKRYESVEARAISRTVFDQVSTRAHSAAAALKAAHSQVVGARAGVALYRAAEDTADAATNVAEAKVKQAELNLSYCTVTSPIDGRITARSVNLGAYVQPGQLLLAIVPTHVWITANFKETQLTDMRAGQSVELRMDAYPDLRLRGHVESLQAGSGSRFSLLPPENAVGNYIKVVQRVPVKIELDGVVAAGLDVAPGMSVVPTVKVR
jgi:membrane fusion protein (multidrug efflux system)